MSSLLTGLAMRGAGLTPPGKTALTPRGRARFEAPAGFAEVGTDGLSVEAAPDAAIATPRLLDGDSLPPSQQSTMPGQPPALSSQPERQRRERQPIEPTPPVPIVAAEPAAASAELTATQPLPTPESGNVGSPKPVVSAVADRPASPGEEKPEPPAVDERLPFIAPIDPIQMVLDHLAASRDSDQPAPELRGPSPEQQPPSGRDFAIIDAPSTAPGVTVSIDRIQVIIEPPPRPAAQQSPSIQPLGFAAYARARRGVPR